MGMMNFLKGKKILVTGAAGFVGANVLARFKEMPEVKVRAVYHKREPVIFAENIESASADLTSIRDCKQVVKDIDYVMMFAAKIDRRGNSIESQTSNLLMNIQMLESAYQAGVKKFLWLSSVTAYPLSSEPLREEQLFSADPADKYFSSAWTIRYIETLCRMYATKLERPMPVSVLRPAAIYGEYCDFGFATCHVLPALIRRVAERQNPLTIWGTGETKRDFVYVSDVVSACFLALERIGEFEVLNIGMGKSYSVRELLDLILDIEGYTDAPVVFDSSKPDNAPSILIDCTKAKKVIGFEAKVSLREGLVKTIEWFKAAARSEVRI